ncbi:MULTISPECIES: FecR domain-containing protein [unclassified Arcicella]|uniref:FecR family protein n=1 Tax=unclassified Arcicella TaxID=2644986 RepID=UPI00285D9808|nr:MULTISPECIES: FecR domain-containing protein [unclassified Arcicella]MDR6562452.1 ferric-dicitrate binding protein FerR (iron transport regulator) [Arcicella sp. BE51]MDR6812346.1 ferric-dicitrate binding protein FerR (iron transport regulator) [Arcicella sp. BE140]MDR6823516.1 ferric-dicitrate binding protein FerR (iron transport regulator) [Arcicella sp. BE139]
MQHYKNYRPEDFASDASFRRWVLEGNDYDTIFWENWIDNNPEKREDIENSKNILLSITNAFNQISDDELQEELEKLEFKLDEKEDAQSKLKTFLFNRRFFYVAASVAMLLGGFWWFVKQTGNMRYGDMLFHSNKTVLVNNDLIEKENYTGHQVTVALADGSIVILQNESKISYPKTFAKEKREVYLEGEAFFEIAKDPQKPFYVFANDLVTKVLGTSFSVKNDKISKKVKVIVKTGRVSVFERTEENLNKQQTQTQLDGLVLTPNQQVVFDEVDKRMQRSTVENPEILAMPIQKNLFEFDHTPIADVFKKLEESYGLKVMFDKDVMKNCYLTASLADEPLFEKLLLICKTIDARYEVIDAQIIIYSKGCI